MPLLGLNIRAPMLLGQIDNWRRLGERFSGEHLEWRFEDFVGLATIAVVLVAGYLLLCRLAAWQDKTTNRPQRLFRELADSHGLSFFQRRLCREVARKEQLAEPAELFVRPDLCEPIASRDASLADRLYGTNR